MRIDAENSAGDTPQSPSVPPSGTHDGQLGHRTAGSAVWLIAVRLVTKGIDFLTLLILARLLAPADFGVIAIAMTVVSIVEAVFELPVYQVLINHDHADRRHFDTAFTLSALRGVALALLLTACAVPLSHFYHDSRLVVLIMILSLAPAIRGISSSRMAIFIKQLDFRRELTCEMVSKVASFALSSLAAWVFRDYRALMVGILVTPITWTITSYILAPYRPRLSLSAWPDFAHFMSWTTASQLLSALNWQCDRLILGRFVGQSELGHFSLANDLSYVPEQALVRPIVRPLISAFALIRNERDRLGSAYLKATNTVLAIGTPVLVSLSLLADPVVRFALGGKWVASIGILQWLPLTLIPPLFTSPFSSLAMAIGRPEAVLRQTAAEAASKLPTMIVGAALLGVEGAIIARAISAVLTAIAVLYLVRRLVGTPMLRQLAVTWRTVASAVVLTGVLLLVRPWLSGQDGLMLGVTLSIASAIGFTAYGATLALLWQVSGRPAGVEHTIFDRVVRPLLSRFART